MPTARELSLIDIDFLRLIVTSLLSSSSINDENENDPSFRLQRAILQQAKSRLSHFFRRYCGQFRVPRLAEQKRIENRSLERPERHRREIQDKKPDVARDEDGLFIAVCMKRHDKIRNQKPQERGNSK
jgi:hypothetical protein